MVGFFAALFKSSKWNDDPNQKQLVQFILDAALHNVSCGSEGKALNARKVFQYAIECGWSDREIGNRLVHATSMIKLLTDAATYQQAVEIAEGLYQANAGSGRYVEKRLW